MAGGVDGSAGSAGAGPGRGAEAGAGPGAGTAVGADAVRAVCAARGGGEVDRAAGALAGRPWGRWRRRRRPCRQGGRGAGGGAGVRAGGAVRAAGGMVWDGAGAGGAVWPGGTGGTARDAGSGRRPTPGRKNTVLSSSGSPLTWASSRCAAAPLWLVLAQTVVFYHPFQRKAVFRVGGVSPGQSVGECLRVGGHFHCILIDRGGRQQPAVLVKCLR